MKVEFWPWLTSNDLLWPSIVWLFDCSIGCCWDPARSKLAWPWLILVFFDEHLWHFKIIQKSSKILIKQWQHAECGFKIKLKKPRHTTSTTQNQPKMSSVTLISWWRHVFNKKFSKKFQKWFEIFCQKIKLSSLNFMFNKIFEFCDVSRIIFRKHENS